MFLCVGTVFWAPDKFSARGLYLGLGHDKGRVSGKPYRLQVFPRERHGVRSNEANELMDATVLQLVGVRLGAVSACVMR
jgi:hypothetical protein